MADGNRKGRLRLGGMTGETAKRSMAKSVAYRMYSSFVVTPLIGYYVSGSVTVALGLSVAELLIKPFTYWAFERAASRIGWGYKSRTPRKAAARASAN